MKTASEILCDLVSIRTDSEIKTNRDIVEYITDILKKYDIPFALIPTGNLNNIVAGINVCSLKDISHGIVLSGHMDTVGCLFQNWSTAPFQGIQKDDKIFGRGTVDMKYFIAVILSLLSQLKNVSYPIFLAFSCDEETEVSGIRDIMTFLEKQNIFPKYALIGEATDFKPAVSNRGYIGYQTQIHGVSGHAGSPELGTNAIYIASQIISQIEKFNHVYAKQGITLNVGKIAGGSERNSIPDTVCFDWEIRYEKDAVKDKILAELDAFYQKLKAEYPKASLLNEIKETLPVFEDKESILCHTAEVILQTEKIPYPYASEAGFFQAHGIDTLICGAGDLKQAHTSDEFILVSDVATYADFLLKLLKKLP